MIQPSQLEKFRAFTTSGGLTAPENLTKSQQLKALSESLSASLSATVSSEADYTRDGIQSLPAAIQTLSAECLSASSALSENIAYIELAATQEDLTQVAKGVEVKRLLDGVPNDTPAESMLPITSKTELLNLESDLNYINADLAVVQSVMADVNAILVQPTPEPDPEGNPVEPVIPPMPQELIDTALYVASELEAVFTLVDTSADTIAAMAQAAAAERIIALGYFKQAVQFTIGESQSSDPAIKDAAGQIYPTPQS